MTRHATRATGMLLVALSLLAGCVSLPDSGNVTTRPGQEPVDQSVGSFDYTPSGPRPGAPPVQIVEDFLLAMQASPQSTAVARKFLTDEGSVGWFPDKTTLVYGAKLVSGGAKSFQVHLEDTVQLDDRGTWLGRVGGRRGVNYTLDLVRERGEWRITNPPDALVIPRTHFTTRYRQYFVYFFDPTGRVLVPEPTYLPHGEQAATLLVRRLLRGPDPRWDGVLRTFIPGGTEYVLSVPVSADGVAQVGLNERLLQLSQDNRQMVLAQLAWTLRQVSGVHAMRVTVDGAPLDIPGAGSPQSLTAWPELDPSVPAASKEVFGIRGGDVVALDAGATEETVGVFGAREYALRDIAVDLAGERVAGVTEDGTTAVVAPRGSGTRQPPDAEQTEVVATGVDLARPAWDVFGDLWLVDRTAAGASVTVAAAGAVGGAEPVEAPGLDREQVSAFVVSRDGSRLVAVVRGPSGDHLMASRVLRGPSGRVRGLTRAVEVPLAQGGVDEIRDVAWRTPTSLAVLTGPTPESSQVLLALVDGSTELADLDSTAEILRRRADHLAAAPSPGAPVFLGGPRGELYQLGPDGHWAEDSAGTPLFAPTLAG